jgi:divalent metal cation (Fe/Co/Zn/Cd) transporter
VYISFVSGSLAFLASAVDSFLDIVSQSIIFYAVR